MSVRVLMVCTGNICRSVMAQQVVGDALGRAGISAQVDSAGVSDEERGKTPDPRTVRALHEAGYAVPRHRARQVRADELGRWDLVLAMTAWHRRVLQGLARERGLALRPSTLGDPHSVDIRLFRSFAGGGNAEVPDPWYGGRAHFAHALELIEDATPALVRHIARLVARGARVAPCDRES